MEKLFDFIVFHTTSLIFQYNLKISITETVFLFGNLDAFANENTPCLRQEWNLLVFSFLLPPSSKTGLEAWLSI